jgi:glutathione S-transferase
MKGGMRLVIANKNYSSWSLRPWLLLKQLGIPFEEELISFNAPDFAARVRRVNPAGRVPVLVDGELSIWDSLAIVEYAAELKPEAGVWPKDRAARARARSLCAEMHSGFAAMREVLGMNCSARFPTPLLPNACRRDVERMLEMWRDTRRQFGAGGPFLFGAFCAADAFFAPVTRRFVTYGIELPPDAKKYVEAIESLPAMQAWLAAAKDEREFYARDEPYRDAPP